MDLISSFKLEEHNGEYTIIVQLNPNNTEFSNELGYIEKEKRDQLFSYITAYVKEKFPNIKSCICKIMLGSILVSVVPMANDVTLASTGQTAQTQYTNYTVVSGDSLWVISQKFKVSVADIKTLNNLTSDTISVNQILKIPSTNTTTPTTTVYSVKSGDSLSKIASIFGVTVTALKSANNLTSDTIYVGQNLTIPKEETTTNNSVYQVKAGDSLSKIAATFGVTVTALKSANNLTSDTIYVDQKLTIPSSTSTNETTPPKETSPTSSVYEVKSGDSLWGISQKFNITVNELKAMNNLTSDHLYVGQILKLTATADSVDPTISYITYAVKSGDNLWSISVDHGIPMDELLTANGLTSSSLLSIGQKLTIPVHNIPVKPTMGAQYGEYLDWWTEAQYVFPLNTEAKVTDFHTGKTFTIKRTIGANHADCEPLTASDTAIAKDIWSGFSWSARPVLVEVNGRKLAASMSFMPHSVQYITNNNFEGHFDIHFLNSTRHKDGAIDTDHQDKIKVAAGIK